MKLSEVKEKTKGVDDKILELIDLKTEDDMKQVISQLQSTEKSFATQMQSTEKSFVTKMQSIENALVSRMDASDQKHEAKFNLLLWVVSIAFAVIAIAVAIVALK